MKNPIVIVGGGISGLAAAFFLEQQGHKNIVVLEATNRFGGIIKTRYQDNLIIEEGPESFATAQSAIFEVLETIGLTNQIIKPKTRNFLLGVKGSLLSPPSGMVALVPTDLEALKQSDLFSPQGIQEILAEKDRPTKTATQDESLSDFFTRRFGREMLDRYAGILLAGIQSADANQLSMAASYPQFLALEQRYGSLTVAASAILKRTGGKIPLPFKSLKNGLESMIEPLIDVLKLTQLKLNKAVLQITKSQTGYEIFTEREKISCKHLILATPSRISSRLVRSFDDNLSLELKGIPASSSIVTSFLFDRDDIDLPLGKSGFLLSKEMQLNLSAATFSSSKWENRCSNEQVLLRGYLGRAENLAETSDVSILSLVLEELSSYLSIKGAPKIKLVHRWQNARPQYQLGHLNRLQQIKKLTMNHKGLILTGCSYQGVGIAACIEQAKQLANHFSTR